MSNYTKLTNYAAKDTLVEGDLNKIIKGTELDAEFVAIQTAITSKADLNSPNFTGIPRAPTAAFGTNTTQVATTAFVQQNGVPVGGIIMWSGIIANIPQGYALCNGSNGTPDLRDKFIIGAGNTYSPAATGGSATATLVEANLPSHTHTCTGATAAAGSHTHTATDSGHTHSYLKSVATGGIAGGTGALDGNSSDSTGSGSANITVSTAPSHTHDINLTLGNTGSGTAFSILPPYFALAYIMRTA